jgi:hypothetical protein
MIYTLSGRVEVALRGCFCGGKILMPDKNTQVRPGTAVIYHDRLPLPYTCPKLPQMNHINLRTHLC